MDVEARPLGTEIELAQGVTATIVGIVLRPGRTLHEPSLSYEVEWWDARKVNTAVFHSSQVTAQQSRQCRIGFSRNNGD